MSEYIQTGVYLEPVECELLVHALEQGDACTDHRVAAILSRLVAAATPKEKMPVGLTLAEGIKNLF